MLRYLAQLVATAAVVHSCWFEPSGPSQVSLFASNRTDQSYVLRVGPDASDICYRLDPASAGQFFEGRVDIGEGSTPPLRLYRQDGSFWTNLGPRTTSDVFVLMQGDSMDIIPVRYRQAPSGSGPALFDLPQIRELDGRVRPAFFPTTNEACSPGGP